MGSYHSSRPLLTLATADQSPNPRSILDEELEEPPRPYSPASMVSLLHFHGDKLSHGRLQKLAITMAKQACDYRATVRETSDDVECLEKELTDLRVTEAQALGNDPLEGYVANDLHLPAFLIPDSMGVYSVARYVLLRSPVGYVMDTPWSRARIVEGEPPLS
jgi:hypothetical protein